MRPDAVVHRGDVWLYAMGDDGLLHLLRADSERRRVVDRVTIESSPEHPPS